MNIPYQRLEPEILRAVIPEYVTRESTDYGDKVYTIDEKIAAVQLELEKGSAKIVFDKESETCNIVANE